MTISRFEKLLHNSRELPTSSSQNGIPQINRNLNQIAEESYIMANKINEEDINESSGLDRNRGHYFLAQSGMNAQETSRKLRTMDTKFHFEPVKKAVKHTDVEAYLNEVQEKLMKDTIDESRKYTREMFLDSMDEQLHKNWQRSKAQLLQNWDLEQDNKLFGRGIGITGRSSNREAQILPYANVISDLNKKRLTYDRMPLTQKFQQLMMKFTDEYATSSQRKSLGRVWDITTHFTMKNYIDENPVKKRRQLLNSSRQWLENQYRAIVEDTLFKQATVAKVGGAPSVLHRMHKFMEVQFKSAKSYTMRPLTHTEEYTWIYPNLEIDRNTSTPIWLFLYVLLRSGLSQLALQYVKNHVESFHRTNQFPALFEEYIANDQLSAESKFNVFAEYRLMKYGNTPADPFKILLYKIMGKCELNIKSENDVIDTIEDYIWLQFNLIDEVEYTLVELQETISVQHGEKDFDKNGLNPWYYFHILLLTLQFEKAVDFMYSKEPFRLEAVHFGITFAYYGLLNFPSKPRDSRFDLLVIEDSHKYCLNLGRLIELYVRHYLMKTHMNDDTVIQYIYLLTLYPRHQDMNLLAQEQFCDFYSVKQQQGHNLVDMLQYKSLLGLEKDEEFKQHILNPIASRLQDNGRYKEAISIYDSFVYNSNKDYTTDILRILNRQLDYTLNQCFFDFGNDATDNKRKQVSQEIVDYCISFTKKKATTFNVMDHHLQYSDDVSRIHYILLHFLQACVKFESGQYQEALESIQITHVLPLNNDYQMICRAVEDYNESKDDIIRNHIPDIVIMTLDIVYELWKKNNTMIVSPSHESYKTSLTKMYEDYINSIMVFVGMISSKIPASVLQKMNRKVSEIHH
ncbi:Nup93/Nic96-domain-containing protein [Mycotypha africana]|uniref:Nup93/Nic96-domain-containing protein n=1 Tax=Mycotypha africana TaxID=64632 RepID=UPI0023013979|nr:Nup93/Nic96-domain-containing protein [Mycotypha africana]KAI8967645.1 Nup93/Nic96-domain-containing protein [Mycotypha africana]